MPESDRKIVANCWALVVPKLADVNRGFLIQFKQLNRSQIPQNLFNFGRHIVNGSHAVNHLQFALGIEVADQR